jgi:hypothetical protein
VLYFSPVPSLSPFPYHGSGINVWNTMELVTNLLQFWNSEKNVYLEFGR